MKTVVRAAAAGAAGAAVAVVVLAGPARADLAEDIDSLAVEAEQREGYDREHFGDYDRDALLDRNQQRWPDCDGFYSFADDRCHDESGEVHADHIVALAEAWDSGAHSWPDGDLDTFAGHMDNLWALTGPLNLSKSDDDAAEWLPPHEPAVCSYLHRYVGVKLEWGLSVDQAEKDALSDAAGDCADAGGDRATEDGDDTANADDADDADDAVDSRGGVGTPQAAGGPEASDRADAAAGEQASDQQDEGTSVGAVVVVFVLLGLAVLLATAGLYGLARRGSAR